MNIYIDLHEIKSYSGEVVAAQAEMDILTSVNDRIDMDKLRRFRDDVERYINEGLSKLLESNRV